MRTFRSTSLSSGPLRILLLVLLALVGPVGLAACDGGHGGGEMGEEVVVEGEPVQVGELEYNVLFSRPLNRYDVEDREYLRDQPKLKPGQIYLGVFVKVENLDEDKGHEIPETFEVVDTSGQRYENLESESNYRLRTGTVLGPGDQDPAIDSTPQVGPIQAALLIFLIDDETLELRPIELEIPGEEDGEVVRAELDI